MEFLQNHYKDGVIDLSNYKLTKFPMELLIFKELKVLNLSNNYIISIPSEIGQLTNLQQLWLSCNQLTSIPKEIVQLVNLQKLSLSSNQLTFFLPEIGQLRNLERLFLSNNKLTSISIELGQLRNLKILDLSSNQLTSFPKEIGQLVNLQQLWSFNNQLTSIPPELGQLVNLQELYLSDTQLTSIPPELGQLTNLQVLSLPDNQLTSIPPEIGQLINLREFYLWGNPIEYIPPPVQRMLNIQNEGQQVYQDNQSIHNSSIQKSFRESVNRLLSKKPELSLERTLEEIVSSELSDNCKSSLVEYSSRQDIHGELNITFGELLVVVWDRIRTHENKQDILPILSQEISDALCMCFTGRITRLVNSLSGFVPEVEIKISDNEQISNLVIITKDKIIPYDVDSHKSFLSKEMKERGYSQDIINEWVSYL